MTRKPLSRVNLSNCTKICSFNCSGITGLDIIPTRVCKNIAERADRKVNSNAQLELSTEQGLLDAFDAELELFQFTVPSYHHLHFFSWCLHGGFIKLQVLVEDLVHAYNNITFLQARGFSR